MPELSQTVVQIPRSGIRELMDLAATLTDVIHLEVGEPSFDTPAHIVEAATKAAHEGYTHYTPNMGLLSLRQKLVDKMRRANGVEISPENIVVTPGAVTALATAMQTIVSPGDEVLLPDPGWPNYHSMVVVNGGIPRRYTMDTANGFLPDPERLESQIGPCTKAIVTNSPSNPAGTVFPSPLVARLVEIARQHDLFLVSDEVYEEIVFEGEQTCALRFDTDGRVLYVGGFSKSYAMTGWRLGYLVASEKVIPQVSKLQEPWVCCAPSISQKAGEAALEGPQDCVREMRDAYKRRRDLAVNILTDLRVPFVRPSGAFYLMADISRAGMDSYSFAKAFLRESRVAVAPGDTFGPAAGNYVRISLATADEQLAEGLRRLSAFLQH